MTPAPKVNGGGGRMLTADLAARAIVASAYAYGDDPVRAMTAKSGKTRRCLTPALYGISTVTGVKVGRLRKIFHMGGMQSRPEDPAFNRAMTAAFRAADYANWRPETRESLGGGQNNDLLVGDGPGQALAAIENIVAFVPQPKPMRPPLELVKRGERAAPTDRPPVPVRRYVAPVKITQSSALSDRILDLLKDRALTAKSVATILDAKELYVSQTLSALAHEGLVDADDPPPPAGRDCMLWRIKFLAVDGQ